MRSGGSGVCAIESEKQKIKKYKPTAKHEIRGNILFCFITASVCN